MDETWDRMWTLFHEARALPAEARTAFLDQACANDPALRADWEAELEDVRNGMLDLRKALADELRALTGSDRFGFIAQHRGMFSRLGLSPETVARLRDEHAIYMVGDSRINVAGLNAQTVPVLARAIVEVGG